MILTFAPSAARHYPHEVAREVIELAESPVRVVDPDGATSRLWIAPSALAALHYRRPRGRTGPIPIAVRGVEIGPETYHVFHCHRVRAKDRQHWAEGGRS